ncbi:hypothetical protein DXG03_003061 [Asterophora parasitica]|uniref:Uncharacterized protein n=1 Tax=Asterophora parasitica TaxID=117018 RepID=A0A9P7KAN4_9AGAR|nr:hypothetical protein DXG03_003061 [Asterophora parasitica]
MNLTFNLDNHTYASYVHRGSHNLASGYHSGINVFSKTGLSKTAHILRVEVGLGSVFLLDYLVYTRTEQNAASNSSSDTATPLAQDIPALSEPDSASKKRHNIGTFAGAVGGSVGVLAILSLGLAFSIIKRRRNYGRRELLSHHQNQQNRTRREQNRDSLHTNGSDDSPPMMIGPQPFVPTFFPSTRVPSDSSPDPPPYVESLSTSSPSRSDGSHSGGPAITMVSSATLPASYATPYADVPPHFPPPLDDPLSSPPPFVPAVPPGELQPRDSPNVNAEEEVEYTIDGLEVIPRAHAPPSQPRHRSQNIPSSS